MVATVAANAKMPRTSKIVASMALPSLWRLQVFDTFQSCKPEYAKHDDYRHQCRCHYQRH